MQNNVTSPSFLSIFPLTPAYPSTPHPSSGYHTSAFRPPSGKRRRLHPGVHPSAYRDLYARIDLEKNRRIYLEEEDEQGVLTPDWVEWNVVIRRCIGRLPRPLNRRLIYLSRFYGETAIYHPYEDILLVEHLQDQLYAAYMRECRLKRAMRNVWGRWKTWKMDRRYAIEWNGQPDVDPITLEPPQKAIIVYSWAQRKRYLFDAKSISLHIEAQLTHHSGGFPVPKDPRNPWINVDFPLRELVSIYLQLKECGELRWAFQTFHAARFDIRRWTRQQQPLLVRRSLEDGLRNLPHLPFLRQSFLEFIVRTLEGENLPIAKWEKIYEYALEHYSRHPVIQQWAQWYIESHVPNHSGVVVIEINKIWRRQHQLIQLIMREGRAIRH